MRRAIVTSRNARITAVGTVRLARVDGQTEERLVMPFMHVIRFRQSFNCRLFDGFLFVVS